jgi:hypothetical protein
MEVHHHPEVEQKGFKGYVLEGLMIFLAVMLGFFAESLREHISEHQRAKEYAATMVSDLAADTADLSGYVSYFSLAAHNIDTLMQLLSTTDPRQVVSGKLYWYGLWGGAHRIYVPHDATIQELKSSGSLRFFSNATLTRDIARYDQLCQSMKLNETNQQAIYTEVRKYRGQIFAFTFNDSANNVYKAFRTTKSYAPVAAFIQTNPPLLSYDKVLFNQYIEMVRSRFMQLEVANADTLLHRATALIGDLNKEFPVRP